MSSEFGVVEGIVRRNRSAFYEWVDTRPPGSLPSLAFPIGQRGLAKPTDYFIADPLYHLAADPNFPLLKNPTQLDTLVKTSADDELELIILEHQSSPVTDMEALDEYQPVFEEYLRVDMGRGEVEPPPLPNSIDRLHLILVNDLREGLLSPSDFVTHYIHLQKIVGDIEHPELHIGSYEDQVLLRRRGVGRGIYKRIEEIGRALHARYLTGQNTTENYGFFVNVLGRIPYNNLPKTRQKIFQQNHIFINKDTFTVLPLNPRDRAMFARRAKAAE